MSKRRPKCRKHQALIAILLFSALLSLCVPAWASDLPCTSARPRVFAIVSTTSIQMKSVRMKPEAVVAPLQMGVPFGCRSPQMRGPYSMLKHSEDGYSSVKRPLSVVKKTHRCILPNRRRLRCGTSIALQLPAWSRPSISGTRAEYGHIRGRGECRCHCPAFCQGGQRSLTSLRIAPLKLAYRLFCFGKFT